jgi:ATP-dependent Zn protease
MTIAPEQIRRAGLTPAARMVFFFLTMALLAVVLFQTSRKSPTAPAAAAMSYSDFSSQVDKNNISSAKLLEGRSATQIQGQLRQPSQNFTATVPNEVVPELTQKLQKQGAVVDIREATGANPASATSLLINLAPLLVILLLAIFVFRMRRNRQNQTQQGTPTSGPLG